MSGANKRGPVIQRTGFDDTKRLESQGLLQPVTHENPLPVGLGDETTNELIALLSCLVDEAKKIKQHLELITGANL